MIPESTVTAKITPLLIAVYGIALYFAGVATAQRSWLWAGILITFAFGMSLWLRHWVFALKEREFERGAGYHGSSRHNLRVVSEMEVHDVPKSAERWLNNDQ